MAAWTLSRAGLRARRAALGGATRMSAGADCTPASFSQPPGTSPPAVGTRGQAAWGVTSQVAGSRGGPVTCLVEDIGRRGSGLLANELCTVLSEDSRVCPSPRRPQERLNTQRPRRGANQDVSAERLPLEQAEEEEGPGALPSAVPTACGARRPRALLPRGFALWGSGAARKGRR